MVTIDDYFATSKKKSKLERLAFDHGFKKKGKNSYQRGNDYLFYFKKNPVYVQNVVTEEELKEISTALDTKYVSRNMEAFAYASLIPNSLLGGGLLGAYLITLGVPGAILILTMGGAGISSAIHTFKYFSKQSEKLKNADDVLAKHDYKIHSRESAIKMI